MHHYHLTLPTGSFQYGVLEFSSSTGGGGQFNLSQMKLEKGIIPTQWIPRPKIFRRNYVVIYPWTTSVSGWSSPVTLDMKNYGGTKRTVEAAAELGFVKNDGWAWFGVQGIDEEGNWVQITSLESNNDTGKDPVKRDNMIVPLSSNQELRLFFDPTYLTASSYIDFRIIGFWDYE